MVDLIDNVAALIEEELIGRKILMAKEMGRIYTASTGAHIFNIENKLRMHKQGMMLNPNSPRIPLHYRQKYGEMITRHNNRWLRPIAEANANAKDTRVHIITVAPIGTGKTLYMEQFLFIENAMLRGTYIQPVFKGSMTEPGWIGTMTLDRNQTHTEHGEAFMNAMSIIGADEFHAIAERMRSTHSNTLEDQLLMSLDHGHVSKSLAAGSLEYTTYATLHGGIQPTRIQMGSGMARRMCFINFMPTKTDYDNMRQAWFESWGVHAHYNRLQQIRASINAKIKDLQQVRRIELGMDELKDFVTNMNIPHFEIDLLFRLSLGWTIMSTNIADGIEIKLTDDIKDMMRKQVKWRDEVKFGSELSQIYQLLKENNGRMRKQDVIRHFVKMQNIPPSNIKVSLTEMVKLGMVRDNAFNISVREDNEQEGADTVNE